MSPTMKGYCAACEETRTLASVKRTEKVRVRGDEFAVKVVLWRCQSCNTEFEGRDAIDEVAEAYRRYRAKHRMMQPEEIRALRQQFGLTQTELAGILGFGLVTLSRYETGMLQSESQDRMLQMVRDPRSFLGFLGKLDPSATITQERIEELKRRAREDASDQELLDAELASLLGYAGDILSGNSQFQFKKLVNSVLYYCVQPDWKTKINKFLFYVDFKGFRKLGQSITGARYVHLPFGPCPDQFQRLFGLLSDMGRIGIEEMVAPQFSGEKVHSLLQPNLGVFSKDEIDIIEAVSKRLRRMTAKRASELSHQEKGYRETDDGDFISYIFAKDLLL